MDKPPVTDPREMRKVIRETAYRGHRFDTSNSASLASPIARNVLMAAERDGWSGEDTMTALAYHALLEIDRLYSQLIESVNMQVYRPMIISKEDLNHAIKATELTPRSSQGTDEDATPH